MISSQMTTYRSQNGLAALFASATLGDLLRLFMLDPQREFYQRELQRLTGAHLRQLQRDLLRLRQAGLVTRRAHRQPHLLSGRRRASGVRGVIRAAVMKTLGLGDVLREALQEAPRRRGLGRVRLWLVRARRRCRRERHGPLRRRVGVAARGRGRIRFVRRRAGAGARPDHPYTGRLDDAVAGRQTTSSCRCLTALGYGPLVTKTRLQSWLEAGALRRHRTSRAEVVDVLAVWRTGTSPTPR